MRGGLLMSNECMSIPIAKGSLGTPCIICGETVPIDHIYDVPKTCDKCKKAVIYMRERLGVDHEQ